MAVSSEQYASILSRLVALELTMNNVVTAINQLVSVQQVQALLVQFTTDIEDLKTDVETLSTRIETLEEESFE